MCECLWECSQECLHLCYLFIYLQDYTDTEVLLSRDNVDQNALLEYAREAADFSTNHQLPTLDFAMNHYGQPDVAMFDFTCMYATENAALLRQRRGHRLMVALVGDSLLEVKGANTPLNRTYSRQGTNKSCLIYLMIMHVDDKGCFFFFIANGRQFFLCISLKMLKVMK